MIDEFKNLAVLRIKRLICFVQTYNYLGLYKTTECVFRIETTHYNAFYNWIVNRVLYDPVASFWIPHV